jgi:hypothetical protein
MTKTIPAIKKLAEKTADIQFPRVSESKNPKHVRITTAIIDKPIKYMIICSNRDSRPVRFQRIKETEITIDNRDGTPKYQRSVSNVASKGETPHVKLRNIEAIPDSPAMVRNHCIGERFISSSIKTRKLSKVDLTTFLE